ncbi:hypothetical protein [Minwuia thermotolerans]|uniref:Uncharacterized protein n=1 Tax=Minwuia thermotolerans TaxID=2056226 RepID=A0A2M9G7F4_9PROT|nr:hypothetical protein [Minwuia thermotolerans]PJK31606.1 hypothetical protein CVT23_00685 [Minwuia thermotolerans]
MTDPALKARIDHALRYPFDPPGRSYLFRDGRMEEIERFEAEGRVPVVASGSNGSPLRLREKYGDAGEIPVSFGTIRDLVPVFAARITSYGSVPATLAVLEGERAGVHVTWLTEGQLEIMHETESVGRGYAYCRLDGFELDLGPHGRPESAFAYIALHGAFAPDGRALPLHQVSQHEAQAHAARLAAHAGELHEFVGRNLADLEHRGRANDALGRFGLPVAHPRIVRLI